MTNATPRIPGREPIDWWLMAGIAVALALLACGCLLLMDVVRQG